MQQKQVLIFSDDNGFLGFARYAGAYRIASELRQHGFDTQVVDFFASYSLDQLKLVLNQFVSKETLFIGFATSLWVQDYDGEFKNYIYNSYETHLKSIFPHSDDFMNQLFSSARKINPEIRFVVGGSKAEALSHPDIDHWVIGQAETAVIELAQRLREKQFEQIPKIIEGNKYVYADFSTSSIEWQKQDFIFEKECLPIEIARGCIFRCSFCYYPLNGKKKNEYTKSKAHLKEEILKAHHQHGTETFLFTDDLINDSLEKVQMLAEISRELPFRIEWSGFCRLDLLYTYPEMIPLLKESGIRSAYFGIETLHHIAGARSGKGLGKEKILQTLDRVKSFWQSDVMINAGFIVGLPGEPIESVQATLKWLLQEDCPVDVADVGVLNIKARKDLKEIKIFNSRIGEDPNKFGIQVDSNFWSHEQMTSYQAYEIVKNFYSDPQFRKKCRGAPFTMYPRLKNLGYSFEEIRKISFSDLTFKEGARMKRKKLFETYFARLTDGHARGLAKQATDTIPIGHIHN